jgi:hypothetical protein
VSIQRNNTLTHIYVFNFHLAFNFHIVSIQQEFKLKTIKTMKSLVSSALLAFVIAVSVKFLYSPKNEKLQELSGKAPKYWLFTTDNKYHVFSSIERVLVMLGFEKTLVDTSSPETMHYDWDFLWAFEYLNLIPMNYSALKSTQRINHIPGNFHFASKSWLTSGPDLKYVAKGFTNQETLDSYAEKNPNARYVQKHSTNRGVSLKKASELEFTIFDGNNGLFAQVNIKQKKRDIWCEVFQ